jgi:hypothetical protein
MASPRFTVADSSRDADKQLSSGYRERSRSTFTKILVEPKFS